jgi:hypothetical protein
MRIWRIMIRFCDGIAGCKGSFFAQDSHVFLTFAVRKTSETLQRHSHPVRSTIKVVTNRSICEFSTVGWLQF